MQAWVNCITVSRLLRFPAHQAVPYSVKCNQKENAELSQKKNKTVVDSRLCSRYTTHENYLLVFLAEQNLVVISAVMLSYSIAAIGMFDLCALG